MDNLKFAIPQEILDQTVEAIRELQLRLEIEAEAYSLAACRRGEIMAEERLEQAEAAQKLFEFYVNL